MEKRYKGRGSVQILSCACHFSKQCAFVYSWSFDTMIGILKKVEPGACARAAGIGVRGSYRGANNNCLQADR